MQSNRLQFRRALIAVIGLLLAGRILEGVAQPVQVLDTFSVAGQTVTVSRIGPMHHLTSRITSCGQGVLYSTRTDGTLWVNLTGGRGTWSSVSPAAPGVRIACDRIHLYSLVNQTLYHADTLGNGQLQSTGGRVWHTVKDGKNLGVPFGTNEIQGGMGNIYALVLDATTGKWSLHSSELKEYTAPLDYVQGATDSWVLLANNLGTNRATGAGQKSAYTAFTTSVGYRKFNRAFGANPDHTVYYNDTLFYGQNIWTQFKNELVLESITADDSNTMYAVYQKNFGKHLAVFSFSESNCSDNLDNDANGQIDAEDPVCRRKLATNWCQTRTGSYCIDRIQSTEGYSHALVTCNSGGRPPTIRAGLCTKESAGNDRLTEPRANDVPFDAGFYCNIINPDGSWDFKYTGPKPCALLHGSHPNAKVVRAGIFSATGLNDVHARCTNGAVTFSGIGTEPLESAFNGVGHTRNSCVFTVSPREMRVFSAPFPTSAWKEPLFGGRGYSVGHVFDHVPTCPSSDGCPCAASSLVCQVRLSDFGNGDGGFSGRVDNRGRVISTGYNDSNSYDFGMNEGTPLRSLGWGRVVGSRDRDISAQGLGGTPYQGEIYIRYDIGSDRVYAESFIAYYAHVGKRVVEEGQTVRPGQLIGYIGTTGASSAPHVHFGLVRLSNTNGSSTIPASSHSCQPAFDGDKFGYHVCFKLTNNTYGVNIESLAGMIDPYGWRASGIDPMGYRWSKTNTSYGVRGLGAWAPQLWRSTEEPPYPPQ